MIIGAEAAAADRSVGFYAPNPETVLEQCPTTLCGLTGSVVICATAFCLANLSMTSGSVFQE